MSTIEKARHEAQVRWLVAGPLTGAPAGRSFDLSAAALPESLAAAALAVEVTVPDRLRGTGTRTHAVAFPKLRSFAAAEVIAADPLLSRLRSQREALLIARRIIAV